MSTKENGSILDIFQKAKEDKWTIAIAIDGGGIRGTMVAKALAILENELKKAKGTDGKPILGEKETLNKLVKLFAGTSTGSILAATFATGKISGKDILDQYLTLGKEVFNKRVFSLWGLNPPIYDNDKLRKRLWDILQNMNMYELWSNDKKKCIDLIITAFDLKENRTRFIKPWNKPTSSNDIDFTVWTIVDAVLASCAVPIYFPPVKKNNTVFIDGGVSSYGNPAFLAAYEIFVYLKGMLNWDISKTTLLSFGTGKEIPLAKEKGGADGFGCLDWIKATISAYGQSAIDQQGYLVQESYKDKLDFRRFQLDFGDKDLQQKFKFSGSIKMDDVDKIVLLAELGTKMGDDLIHNRPAQSSQNILRR
jgi:hypothetical protein